MKRFLILSALMACSLGAFAQGNIPLLDKVDGHRVTFHYTYSLSQKGGDFAPVTDGEVVLEGNAYKLEGLDLQVISNGTTRWTLDPSAEEVVVETVVKEDLFTNPALFIASYKQYLDKIKVNNSGADSLDVTLTLDEDTRARFILKNIVYSEEKGKSDFSVDEKSLPSSYLVTDLR